jgi:hypothetical protein
MADLIDVLRYFCSHYPNKSDLSKARLVKMVYLADWRSSIYRNRQITDIVWKFNHYGPYVEEPIQLISDHPEFTIQDTTNVFGSRKSVISYHGALSWPSLTQEEVQDLDHVVATTQKMPWGGFLNLVYATYPITTQPRYSPLDLVELATQYREVRQDLGWGVPADPIS